MYCHWDLPGSRPQACWREHPASSHGHYLGLITALQGLVGSHQGLLAEQLFLASPAAAARDVNNIQRHGKLWRDSLNNDS